MGIELFNTLTGQKEPFVPIVAGKVGLYTCGPTVYNYVHIGNLRTYTAADILRRVLEYAGLQVIHIENITDVDDKTINGAQANNKSLEEFTDYYTKAFFRNIETMGISPATKFTKATEHIPEMILMIQKLIDNGLAYRESDGVYFSVAKFANYGQLSKIPLNNLKAGASGRITKDEYEKENVNDFALWKMWTKEDGDVAWDAPFGRGRPGWHIECSAMSTKYLGDFFDIHTGGVDLRFPHHENEIAQTEGATGHKFVRLWNHTEHLLVNGKKMSKSLGNIYTLDDIEKRGFSPLALRYLYLTTHYRQQLNFTWESLEAAQNAYTKLVRTLSASQSPTTSTLPSNSLVKFKNAINDDLNTPKALAVMWENVHTPSLIYEFDKVLGLGLEKAVNDLKIDEENIPPEIRKLASDREEARQKGEFTKADELRLQIETIGYSVSDSISGPLLTKKH